MDVAQMSHVATPPAGLRPKKNAETNFARETRSATRENASSLVSMVPGRFQFWCRTPWFRFSVVMWMVLTRDIVSCRV